MAELTDFIDDIFDSKAIHTFHLIDIESYPVRDVFSILIQDKTTKKNIIWATDAYAKFGKNYSNSAHMSPELFFTGGLISLQPRIEKAADTQQDRTRSKGEVFTPVWICNRMINWEDQEWFGYPDVFNHENEGRTWVVSEGKKEFPEGKTWKDYVDSRRLEITCGEAPFLASRYNAATGEFIEPPSRRIGILDRKLHIITENTENQDEWIKWALRAIQSCYGYEWQGDNLLIARINIFMTFYEHYLWVWSSNPSSELLKTVANIISWNIWQMDGSKDVVPFGRPYEQHVQTTLFDSFSSKQEPKEDVALPSKIYDWRRDKSFKFKECKLRGKMKKKMFDFVIGNPPYQEVNENNSRKPPVYHIFMDAAYCVGNAVELITPARFLFEAGQTPKEWDKKMLADPHLKVLQYEKDASNIFPDPDIKGGIVITYRDESHEYGPIGTFTTCDQLNNILKKVVSTNFTPLSNIISSRGCYRFSDSFFEDYPAAKEIAKNGTGNMIASNTFKKYPEAFSEHPFNEECVKLIGREKNKRVFRYIRRKHLLMNDYIDSYNVLLTEANNEGNFGETLTSTIIATPNEGATDTFISIGTFNTIVEAENVSKYLKTKFARTMLGIKKATQHNPKSVWTYVPCLDFSGQDLDWSKDVSEIDLQLYRKYKLSVEEIEFIEKNVKEMK